MKYEQLGNLVKLTSGFAFKSSLFNTDGKGLPLIRIRDVVRGFSETYYSGEYKKDYLIKNNDALIGMDGEFNIALWKGEKALLNQRVCKIESNNELLDQNYLINFLPKALKDIEDKTPFVTVKHLSIKDIQNIQIPLPPLEEQRRIAEILDKADALIQNRKKAIEKLDELLQATFIDMFGDPVTNPKGWEVKLLQDLSIKIHSGNTPKGGAENYVETGIIFLRSQNVWKNKVVLDDVAYIDEETHAKMSKSSVKHEDILMTKTGRINTENSSLGRAAIYQGSDDSANINGHVYLIRIKEGLSKYFILSILTQPDYYEYIRSICVGGIDKRQLNKEHLEKLPIIFPPQESQARFEKIMKTIGKQKQAMQAQLEVQETLFKSLQQQAFSGQL